MHVCTHFSVMLFTINKYGLTNTSTYITKPGAGLWCVSSGFPCGPSLQPGVETEKRLARIPHYEPDPQEPVEDKTKQGHVQRERCCLNMIFLPREVSVLCMVGQQLIHLDECVIQPLGEFLKGRVSALWLNGTICETARWLDKSAILDARHI